MFDQPVDNRLSAWAQHRSDMALLERDEVLKQVWEFWKNAPFVPFNSNIDPYYSYSWPTPWQIIVDNKYDDFTKALMIGRTLQLITQFRDSKIEIKTFVDKEKHTQYNIVCVDNQWAINYDDNGPVGVEKIRDSFLLENLIELDKVR
jgi:hypothetical protein